MARRIEDVLGLTTEEIAALGPLLNNPTYRAKLQAQADAMETLESQNSKLTTDINAYDKWYMDEIVPTHNKTVKDLEEARVEAAAAKARLEFNQNLNMQRQGEQQVHGTADDAAKAAADKIRQDLNQPKYVSEEVFFNAQDQAGAAIAEAADLIEDHRELYGTRLNLKQLRLDAKAAKLPIRQYWERQFKVSEKRQEISAKAQQEHDDKIRAEERQKLALEFGTGSNPGLVTPRPSANPFTLRTREANGKQPWERNESELAKARVETAYGKAVARGEAN